MFTLQSAAGLTAEVNANGSMRRLSAGDLAVNLFVGSEIEGGPTNLWLRRRDAAAVNVTPLLGPRSITRFAQASASSLIGEGVWRDLRYTLALSLSADAPSWCWRIDVLNEGDVCDLDVLYTQDLALAPYGAVRINEYYVSQYVDHTPLEHDRGGWVIASRQNQAVSGRRPWSIVGSLRRATAYATDALQIFGLDQRSFNAASPRNAPAHRLQHEHSLVALQDEACRLKRGAHANFGFLGVLLADHPSATSASDLEHWEAARSAVDVHARLLPAVNAAGVAPNLFATAEFLSTREFSPAEVDALFSAERRHEERVSDGRLLSFFYARERHVVLRAKELLVQRPHGALLRTGAALTPDESAMTSTAWMSGVFHSMVTQGHVSINRILSTVRSYLGLFRAQGQRVFVEVDGAWRLLGVPSAFEMRRGAARWLYRHGGGLIEVRAEASAAAHELTLHISVREGAPVRVLASHHVALNGDDGAAPGPVVWRREADGVSLAPAPGSEMHARFPNGSLLITPTRGVIEHIGGDELLFEDGVSRGEPYLCLVSAPTQELALSLRGRFVEGAPASMSTQSFELDIAAPKTSALAAAVSRLVDIAPWFVDNALVHYLAPRGLEQYTGGGWGARDVSQGPVELLLAFGDAAPVRDLLLRVMRAQRPDGDWPQWFMFFDRDRHIRAGDSHGDIVFWPVLALAQYLLASGDVGVLDERVPFYAADAGAAEAASVWEHVQRALGLIEARVVSGTTLAAYGHGDWNDSLQPADPAMREHMCSAWTVTLHYQMLTTLAHSLQAIGREREAQQLLSRADRVAQDFQRLLIVDGVLAGYALFDAGAVRYLLHPRDELSGVKYSSLAMIHAILEGLFTPAQARAHLQLLENELSGPDGVRLFDRPMPYRGGEQRLFQRAETATFFGREIGLMYMHAHLRYAQALAHLGEARKFFHALQQANPIGLRGLIPQATLRQANCYYSSSDAAFTDRYDASAEYARVRLGDVALDGGWRVYSSGAGIAMSLLIRRFLGVSQLHEALVLDPVIPPELDGLRATLSVYGRMVALSYNVGAQGCGVIAVAVNGHSAAFTREPNPYRLGAARISRRSIESLLTDGENHIVVHVG